MSDPNAVGRDQRDNSGGAWEGGYMEHGRIMVTFDLKADIIQPIERLEDQVQDLNRKIDASIKERNEMDNKLDSVIQGHVVDDHMVWVRQRRQIEKWVVRGIVAIVPLAAGALVSYLTGVGF